MPLQCNIGKKGRLARLIWGIAFLLAGIAVGVFRAYPTGSKLMWTIAAILAGAGGFAVFEARAGWCALRAMKIKTPM